MKIKRIFNTEELELDDVVLIFTSEIDVDNDTEVGSNPNTDFSRIYLHDNDLFDYLSHGDILFVTDKNEKEVECITLDKECVFKFRRKSNLVKAERIMVYKVLVREEEHAYS